MSGLCGVYGGIVRKLPYGMVCYGIVWYGIEHKHKESLGTYRSVLKQLEASWNRLNAFRACCDLMGAFGRPGRLGSIIPYVCMVCK